MKRALLICLYGWLCVTMVRAQQKVASDSAAVQREQVNVARPELTINDSIKADTLREVVVQSKHGVNFPLSSTMKGEVSWMQKFKDSSLGGLIKKYLPVVNDWITHPFGFAERKRTRKRKKVKKLLEQYDMVDNTDPLQKLLDSVALEMKSTSGGESFGSEK